MVLGILATLWDTYGYILVFQNWFWLGFGLLLARLIWPKFGPYIIPKLYQNGMPVLAQNTFAIWAPGPFLRPLDIAVIPDASFVPSNVK